MNGGKLGFGLMRLPLANPEDVTDIDLEKLKVMVDRFIAAGFNYFDTATPYHGKTYSELAFRECVSARYPRDSFTITDKLSFGLVNRAEELEGYFAGQLERCGVEYFDFYLLHAMNKAHLEQAESMGAFDFVLGKKAEGRIRHVGFSFHDTPEVLDEILTRHPETEYVQIQLNYLDWESEDVQSRACYETAVRHGKQVFVMEPVKGGLLANVPEEARALMAEAEPGMSAASWAVRFAASLPNVAKVLSGMSTVEQVEDNVSYMRDFKPLAESEQEIISKVRDVILSKETIACTACRYCVDGCPKNIAIPEYFRLMNDIGKFGEAYLPRAKRAYSHRVGELGRGRASDCVRCGQCEKRCPQHLPIRSLLESAARTLE